MHCIIREMHVCPDVARRFTRFISQQIVILLALSLLLPHVVVGADIHTPPPANLTQLPIPETRAFASLFRAAVRLDDRAAELQRQGKVIHGLRGGIAEKMGLSTADLETLVNIARKVETRAAIFDTRAKAVIQSTQEKYAGKERKAGVPPPPPELAQWQAERDRIVAEGIAELQLRVGAEAFSTLKTYLGKKVGQQARLVKPE